MPKSVLSRVSHSEKGNGDDDDVDLPSLEQITFGNCSVDRCNMIRFESMI